MTLVFTLFIPEDTFIFTHIYHFISAEKRTLSWTNNL